MGAALSFLTRYEEDGNGWRWKMDPFLQVRKKISEHDLGKKEEEVPSKLKNEQSARQVILTAFWECCNLVYAEFGPDTNKEKQNVTQNLWLYIITSLIWTDTCVYLRIPFLAQNDGESIGNLNYSWNNILSFFVLLSANKKNTITDVWLTASVKKLPTLAPPCCVKKCSTCISPYYASNYI